MKDLEIKMESLMSLGEPVELEVEHKFSNGIYVREMYIPKGTFIVGKRHREETMNMLIKGSMTIMTGEDKFTIEAPYTFVGEKYSRKAGYAHEDSVWINIHRTDSKDLEEIEKQVIITEEEYEALSYKEKECIGI